MTTVPLLEFTMPLRTVSALNVREHEQARARRVKREHEVTEAHLHRLVGPGAGKPGARMVGRFVAVLPLRISLTRLSPRARWMALHGCYHSTDDDAPPGSLKGVRDSIAEWLGLDDGDDRLFWRYAQDRGPMGVRVTIEPELDRVPMPDPRPRAKRERKPKLGRDPLAIDRSRGGGTANMRPAQRFTIVRSDT